MADVFEFRGYRLDLRQRRLLAPGGEAVALRARVFDTLAVLVQRAGEPVSKAELMDAVWPGTVVEENNLNQAISALRQARDLGFQTLRRGLGKRRHHPQSTSI